MQFDGYSLPSPRRIRGCALIAALLASGFAACTSSTINTPSSQPVNATDAASARAVVPASAQASTSGETRPQTRVVRVVIEALADESLGESLGIQGSMTDLDELIALRVRALQAPGVLFEPEIMTAPAEVPADGFQIRIAKAYVNRVMETKSGVVVLTLTTPGGATHFRAQTTGLNWFSSRAEFYGAVRKALDMALADVGARMIRETSESAR